MRSLTPKELAKMTATQVQQAIPFKFFNKNTKIWVEITRTSGSYFCEHLSTIRWTATTIKNTAGYDPTIPVSPVIPKVDTKRTKAISASKETIQKIKSNLEQLQTALKNEEYKLANLESQKDYDIIRITPSMNLATLGKNDLNHLYTSDLCDTHGVPLLANKVTLEGVNIDQTRFFVRYADSKDTKRTTELFIIKPL